MSDTVKIPAKPIATGDTVNKARDMSGLRKWARESRGFGRMMRILEWFTIPAEVLMRHRFGRRWFTPMNFYSGAFLLLMIAAIQYAIDMTIYYVTKFNATWNPFYSETTTPRQYGTDEMLQMILIYVIFGAYHLLSIWWRSRTNDEIHSYDDGTSSIAFVGKFLAGLLNILIDPLIYLYMLLNLTRDQRKTINQPSLINDREAFTNTIVQPLVIFWFAYKDPFLIPKIWLVITALAVAIHANMRETAKKSKILDFQDSAIEAKAMRELRKSMQQNKIEGKKVTKDKKSAPLVPKVKIHYPDLETIIDWVHLEKHPINS